MKKINSLNAFILLLSAVLLLLLVSCGEAETEYDEDALFKFGLTPVKEGLKWGFVDTEGNEILPQIYNNVGHKV